MHHLIQNITHTTVKRVSMFEVFMLMSPVEQDGPEKGIAATEAAVDCVNSGSLLTVPMNVCERLCRRSFSVTAHVFFRVAIVTILFMERTISVFLRT